jgi:hypothetical protein
MRWNEVERILHPKCMLLLRPRVVFGFLSGILSWQHQRIPCSTKIRPSLPPPIHPPHPPPQKNSYISRVSRSSNIDHLVLGTTQYKPAEFAERMLNLKLANMWGVVKWICDRFLAGENALEPGACALPWLGGCGCVL